MYVDAPNVTVDAPVIHNHNRPPALRIEAPNINLPKPGKIRRTFERDENGITIAIIEEPVDDEVPDEGSET